MSRAEEVFRQYGHGFGWTMDKCEMLVDEYDSAEYQDEPFSDEEQEVMKSNV
jgi:hypothetical protein